MQEQFWREERGRPLIKSVAIDSDVSAKPPRYASFAGPPLTAPATSAPAAASPSAAKRAAPASAAEPRRPPGKSISEDFDGSRLSYGIEPKSKKVMMRYPIPGTDKIMWYQRSCDKCGGDHFNFAHDHCARHTVPSLNTVAADDAYGYLVTTEGEDESTGFCASLSTIDATLLRNLGGTPTGKPIRVNGLGATETAGWTTITFFLAARDSHGRDVFLECSHDFHVLPNFLPGLCLGLDFISHHAVSIDIRHDRALLGRYTFPVTEKLPAPYAKEAELCCRTACHIPARASAWVPVDSACLAPGVDYTIHPRLTLTADERAQLGGPVAVASHGISHVLVTNFGVQSITLPRRAPIADAVVARLGDATVALAHAFTLDEPMSPDAMMASMAVGDAWSDGTPFSSVGISRASRNGEERDSVKRFPTPKGV
ncbi:hypothetical protein CF336_g9021 [Tilletia laevis]|nr:hypothetical protein CF328_g8970 [Tilletia controversa]KAE8181162.1 hypothetical protein CF336_g9021 [Tilletia laevis]